MSWTLCAVVAVAAFALSGCAEQSGLGGSGGSDWSEGSAGSGGSNQAGLSLARDVCIRDIEARGGTVVAMESAREVQNRAEIVVQTRRSPATGITERRLCTFYFNTGLHDTRPI